MNAIELYERLFFAFAGMAVLSLGLSIFLFIRFDIPRTYAMLTGKARRKTIQEIEKRNSQTGKLRQYPKVYEQEYTARPASPRRSGSHTGRTDKTGNSGHTGKPGKTGRTARDTAIQPRKQPGPAHRPSPAERPETEVLSTPAMQTVILSKPAGITEDLGQTELLQPVQDIRFYFQITENTVSIHTDELI